jgi:transcriptional regulator with XRE-family HTH domain
MEKIEVLGIVKRELKNKHVSPAELARQLNTNPSSVHGMLNRSTIQVQKLIKLSGILEYNFFREIALKLPYHEPEIIKPDDEEKALKERIRELEIESTTLRRTLKDLIRR